MELQPNPNPSGSLLNRKPEKQRNCPGNGKNARFEMLEQQLQTGGERYFTNEHGRPNRTADGPMKSYSGIRNMFRSVDEY